MPGFPSPPVPADGTAALNTEAAPEAGGRLRVVLLMAGSCLPILGAVLLAPVLPKMLRCAGLVSVGGVGDGLSGWDVVAGVTLSGGVVTVVGRRVRRSRLSWAGTPRSAPLSRERHF